MPRQRSPERDRAFAIFQDHQGNIANREIAKRLGIPEKTVGGWKVKDSWAKRLNGVLQNDKRSTPNEDYPNTKDPQSRKPPSVKDDNEGLNQGSLTGKQAIFVEQYLIHFNATRAAIEAGYSKDTAYSIGWENLRKPQIQAAIRERTEMQLFGLGITRQRVLSEYLKIAFADITDYVEFGQREVAIMVDDVELRDDDGNVLTRKVNYVSLRESEDVDGSLVHEVKQGRDGCSIKLHDKMKALEALSRYTDLLPNSDAHKRRIDEEKLKVEQARLLLEQNKAF